METPTTHQIGHWTLLERRGLKTLCLCVCGKKKEVRTYNITTGVSRSCGCKNREEVAKTCQAKYNVSHYSKTNEWQIKKNKTILARYDTMNYSATAECKDKALRANFKRFGGPSPASSLDIISKMEQTNLKRFGALYFTQSSQYQCQKSEISARRRTTNLEKYGVESTTQVAEIALKGLKKRRYRYLKTHWGTQEELICVGSYEAKVVDFLNHNKINFLWQLVVFKLSTGLTYRPDLYIVDIDRWIEIKGRWIGNAKEKWEEFSTQIHKNSELWNQVKLKEMNIL